MLVCGRAPFPTGLAPAVRRGLTGVVIARLAVNGGIRVVYPFLPVLAHGLGMSFQVLALLVASRSLAGIAGPVLARVVARFRQRALMLGSELVVASGCLLIAASPAAPERFRTVVVGVGFLATGLARPLFDLPMQTWVSARVPVADRGRALGVTELGWALSLAATVPLAGVLIERIGWRSPFVLVAAMAALGMIALLRTMPADDAGASPNAQVPVTLRRSSRAWRSTGLAVCAGAALAVAANESVFVVYGEWLSRDFGMSVRQIGASTLLIVTAELIGDGLVVTVSDRVGLWRTLFSALVVSAAAYSALALTGDRISLAVAAIGALFVALEVIVIVLVAIASTVAQRTQDRARLFGGVMAAIACGNAVGAALAPQIFARGGIALSGAAAACAVTVAAAVLWLGSQQPSRALAH
jgi:predicted MFS family arabinose efflux permease